MPTIKIKCEGAALADFHDLKPFQLDLKSLTEENYLKLRRCIYEYGFTAPIHVWKNGEDLYTLDGHQRCRVLGRMESEGFSIPEVPIAYVHAESFEQAKEILLTHASQFGTVQDQGLYEFMHDAKISLEKLKDITSFPEIVFKDFEVNFFKDPEVDAAADSVPEVEKPFVKKGELWILGNHRLLCADATSSEDVERLMNGEKADMVFTDPPYNIASDSKNYVGEMRPESYGKLKNAKWDKDFDIETALVNLKWASKDAAFTAYIWTSQFLVQRIWNFYSDADYIHYLVWNKTNPMPSLSKRHPTFNTELCVYVANGTERVVNFPEEGHFLSCRTLAQQTAARVHPTQKPVDLIEPILRFSSDSGDNVIDLFAGSGSTLIACEKTNRRCFGMEIDEHYCSIIIKRWEEFTGKKAFKEESEPKVIVRKKGRKS